MNEQRVLVIEDDDDIRRLCEASLEAAGYAVHTAADGTSGLERAEEIEPHVIVVDLTMPRTDGWQVMSRLRADARFANTPVLVLTAVNEPDARVAAFRLGADDYISKPFRIAELQLRVARAMRSRAFHVYFARGLERASTLEIEPMDSVPPAG